MNEWNNIKDKILIKDLITSETGLEFDRNNTLEKCPFCQSGSKKNGTSAFSIKPNENFFKCFSCNEGGDSAKFVAKLKGISNGEAISTLVKKYSSSVPVMNNYSDWEKKLYAIRKNPTEKASQYLSRCRSIKVANLPSKCYYYNSLNNSIVFLSQNEGLLNQRLIEPKPGEPKAINQLESQKFRMKDCVYDACYNPEKSKLFITEGVIDSLSLWPESTISIFSSGNFIKDISVLEKYVQNKEVILAFDADEPGNKATQYYHQLLEDSGLVSDIYKLCLPHENQIRYDFNDLLIEKRLLPFLKTKENYTHLYENRIVKPMPLEVENRDDSFYKQNGFLIKDGQYLVRDKHSEYSISNFLFDIIYHFPDASNKSMRYIKMQNKFETRFILLDSEQLSSIQKFKSAVYSQGEYIFKGSQKNLEDIREHLSQNISVAQKIEDLGWSSDHNVFVLSNGIINTKGDFKMINKYGIVKNNGSTLFIPPNSEIYKDDNNYVEQRKFLYLKGSSSFRSFSELYIKAYGTEGSVGITFLLASLFSDIVFKELTFFPLLYLYGPKGTGKSSFADILLSVFGQSQKPISLMGTSTTKSIFRRLAQYSNSIIYLNEYKKEAASRVDDLLVNLYDRVGYDRAVMSNDNKTHQTKVTSSLIVDGNFLPIKLPRTYSRFIQIDFMKSVFSAEESSEYEKLESICKKETFSCVIPEIMSQRKKFKNEFRYVYYETSKNIKRKYPAFDQRLINNYCVLLATLKILGGVIHIPIEYEQFEDDLMRIAGAQQDILNDTSEVEQFFEAIEVAVRRGHDITLNDYKIDDVYLYISLGSLHEAYCRHMRNVEGVAMDKQTLMKMLKTHPYFVNHNQRVSLNGKQTRVWIFKKECLDR